MRSTIECNFMRIEYFCNGWIIFSWLFINFSTKYFVIWLKLIFKPIYESIWGPINLLFLEIFFRNTKNKGNFIFYLFLTFLTWSVCYYYFSPTFCTIFFLGNNKIFWMRSFRVDKLGAFHWTHGQLVPLF